MNEEFYGMLRDVDAQQQLPYLEGVIQLIDEKQIPMGITNFQQSGAIGLTLNDKIYISNKLIEKLIEFKDHEHYYILLFAILHEMAHYMRIQRSEDGRVITDLNHSVFNVFYDRVVLEETIANKYAEQGFIKIVGRKCYEMEHMYSKLYNNEDAMQDIYLHMFMALRSTRMDYFDFMRKFIL